MGSNKRDLKAYVRYDGSGRVVAGSLVLRRQKPKVGKWKEVQGYQCCNAPILTYQVGGKTFPWGGWPYVIVYCDTTSQNIYTDLPSDQIPQTIEELVSMLNIYASAFGTFSVAADGISVNLNPSFLIAQNFRECLGDLGLEIGQN